MRDGRPALYFRTAGRRLGVLGCAIAVFAVATTFLLGRFWMLTLLAPWPLVGMGLAMMAAPGPVVVTEGTRGEQAWVQTPARHRVVWLAGLVVGIAIGLAMWAVLMPYVVIG